jgi:hypothetical protein
MPKKTGFILAALCGGLFLAVGLARPPAAVAAPAIFASPIQAGCYLAKLDRCKIHVDPFTINITPGKKLVQFRLVATRIGTGTQTMIYDFRTDQSNPAPSLGSSYTPSRVAIDFGVTCGRTYTLSLQGSDSGDAGLINLGVTNQFTCPKATFRQLMPMVKH